MQNIFEAYKLYFMRLDEHHWPEPSERTLSTSDSTMTRSEWKGNLGAASGNLSADNKASYR
jgi:hypothetical protein